MKKRVSDVLISRELLDQLEAISDSLNHGYSAILDTSADGTIESRRALVACGGNKGETKRANVTITKIDKLLKPFQVIEKNRTIVNANKNDVEVVLCDPAVKSKLFMAHTFQYHVQHSMYEESDKFLQDKPREAHAIITMDYKINVS